MTNLPPPNTCPQCRAALPADAPQGLCPACLLAAVAEPTEAGTAPLPKAPPPTREQVAAAFPHLEILELIGAGGMGYVFKARQPKLDRLVALKLLPQHLGADAAFAGRFEREGRVLARLSHPNIVTVHDFGFARAGDLQSPPRTPSTPTDGDCKSPALPQTPDAQPETPNPKLETGFYYLLMEFVDGVNLRQAMRAGRFTPVQALEVVPKICEALQFAHEQGILHRDIKPENILLDAKGRVKLVDFGIAKLVDDGRAELPPGLDANAAQQRGPATLTSATAALGTPSYMAPEQRDRPAEVDHRADIYSLGVVFYEMLTGELPVGKFAPPSTKSASDPRVDQVVLRALEQQRERRQQSAGEIRTQVENIAATPGSNRREAAPTEAPHEVSFAWSAAFLSFATLSPFGIFLASVLALKSKPQQLSLLMAVNGIALAAAGWWIWTALRKRSDDLPTTARWGAILAVTGLLVVPSAFFITQPWTNAAVRQSHTELNERFMETSRHQNQASSARARLERWQSQSLDADVRAELNRRITAFKTQEKNFQDESAALIRRIRALPYQSSSELKTVGFLAAGIALAGLVCGVFGQITIARSGGGLRGGTCAAFAVLALPGIAGLLALFSYGINKSFPQHDESILRGWSAGLFVGAGVLALGLLHWLWQRLARGWDWGRAALLIVLTGLGVAFLPVLGLAALKPFFRTSELRLSNMQLSRDGLVCEANPQGIPTGWAIAWRGVELKAGQPTRRLLFGQHLDGWTLLEETFDASQFSDTDLMNAVEHGPLWIASSSQWRLPFRPETAPQVLLLLTNSAGNGVRIEAELVPDASRPKTPAERATGEAKANEQMRARLKFLREQQVRLTETYGSNDFRVVEQARFIRDMENFLNRRESATQPK